MSDAKGDGKVDYELTGIDTQKNLTSVYNNDGVEVKQTYSRTRELFGDVFQASNWEEAIVSELEEEEKREEPRESQVNPVFISTENNYEFAGFRAPYWVGSEGHWSERQGFYVIGVRDGEKWRQPDKGSIERIEEYLDFDRTELVDDRRIENFQSYVEDVRAPDYWDSEQDAP